MHEVWKDIAGYEGYYQVSNLGSVKSLTLFKKILKPYADKDGYFQVILYKNKTRKLQRVHRLVAQAFIPNENHYPQVNHKDENKQNNCVENLEWCTNDYNIHYGTAIARISQSKMKKVLQISTTGEIVNKWDSVQEAAKDLGIGRSTLFRRCLSSSKPRKYKNYTFKIVKE